MTKQKLRASGLAAFLCFAVVVAAGCPKGALVLLRDGAVTNQSFERAVTTAHHDLDANGQPFVDDATERTLLEISRKIAQADDSAVSLYEKNDKAGALVQVTNCITAIDDALGNGLLGVKNLSKKNEISALLLSLRGGLMTAKAMLSN